MEHVRVSGFESLQGAEFAGLEFGGLAFGISWLAVLQVKGFSSVGSSICHHVLMPWSKLGARVGAGGAALNIEVLP